MSTDGSSGYDYLNQKEDVKNFETGRIKALQEERLHIQKKTFTKWINSFLIKTRMEVEDIFTDLADGRKLLRLLEIISGEKLGKPNNGKMRVHKIENVNKSLAFLHTKVGARHLFGDVTGHASSASGRFGKVCLVTAHY
ncbi:Spectrin beta chain, non-erythrocytic 1 [Amphibalanus amphitrite]|uniref:Spectrin beta chain, non-erythrocytic 1 n=1 Tax=Amphibalanus amphitrite TaxID=1232801 RepID=A0A6A4X5U0_AMPAM|nr:Spectrin beta chain, non-erythrocytic 1 [Amphibalanus amphitrite]